MPRRNARDPVHFALGAVPRIRPKKRGEVGLDSDGPRLRSAISLEWGQVERQQARVSLAHISRALPDAQTKIEVTP
jgi:hypothetical protein